MRPLQTPQRRDEIKVSKLDRIKQEEYQSSQSENENGSYLYMMEGERPFIDGEWSVVQEDHDKIVG